jgi:hypothetical protein
MAISTNSIIHYTDTLEKLSAILCEGLAIKYCAERLQIDTDIKSLAAHPMISFCDIPLSNSYKHFNAYGNYGIGLSKEWANRMGVNPVLYIDKGSSIGRTLGTFIKERRSAKSNLSESQKDEILRIKCFAKNYSGPLKRKLVDERNYRFYDEREWRLVPESHELDGAKFSITLSNYKDNKEKYNRQIQHLRFEFKPEEISYIIVNNTAEIPQIIRLLRAEYMAKCTAEQLDILFSKIASTEQIINDY